MADQAETLRKLMQEYPGTGPRVFAFKGAGASVGTTTVTANLAAVLARSGWRVALIAAAGDLGKQRLAEVFAMDGRRFENGVLQLEPNLWLVSPEELLGGAPDVFAEAAVHSVDVVFMDCGPKGIRSSSLLKAEPVIILTPRRECQIDVPVWASEMMQAGVIVNQARDGADAQRVYKTLFKRAPGGALGSFEYLGHCGHDEKITQAVRKRKFLLDLESGASSVRCFELLAKSFQARYLDQRGVEGRKITTRRRFPPSRFKEEPALMAPGNRTGFWRILLDEVKA